MLNKEPCQKLCICNETNPPQNNTIPLKKNNQTNKKSLHILNEEKDLIFYQCFCDEEEVPYKIRDELWGIEEVRRHWCLRDHCNHWLFPVRYPSLELCSRVGRYLWHERGSHRGPESLYKKQLTRCIIGTIRNLLIERPTIEKFILCEQLFQADWLDWYSRKYIIESLIKYISCNEGMVMFSLEYARLSRGEALGILLALAKSSSSTLKRLYLWNAFDYNQNPVQEKITKRSQFKDTIKLGSNKYLQTLCCYYLNPFCNLRVLAINYGYIADISGKIILFLGSILRNTLRDLQILCLSSEVPNVHRAWREYRAYRIPDCTWKQIQLVAPKLRVAMVFVMLPYYDDVRMFLSKYINLKQFIMNSGLDIERKRVWGIDMIFKTLSHFYSTILVRVSIELNENRDQMDPVLKNLPGEFPNLKILEYTGLFHKSDTMEYMAIKFMSPYIFQNFRRLSLKIQMSSLYTKEYFITLMDKFHLAYPKLKETQPGLFHIGNKVSRLEIFPL